MFLMDQATIGELSFYGSWHFNAVYTDRETHLKFARKSFWDNDIRITQGGQIMGTLHKLFFGQQVLTLPSGERFTLSTSFWEQEVYWRNENGNTVIRYQQATMSSMGKGSISVQDTLPMDTQRVLMAGGLFARHLRRKKASLLVAFFFPMMIALRHV